MSRDFTSARDHALFASELLRSIAIVEERLDEMTEEQRLAMIVTGGIRKHNRDIEYTVELAQAHAGAALALAFTEEREINADAARTRSSSD